MADDRRGTRTRDQAGQSDRGHEAETPTQIPAPGWKDVLKRVLKEGKDDNVPLLAAGTAFYAILSLFPALIAAVTLWGLVADEGQIQQQITSLTSALPPESAKVIGDALRNATTNAGGGLSFAFAAGLATALYSASGGMAGLIKGINLAYDEKETRSFFKVRGLALVLTVGAIVISLTALGLIAVLPIALNFLNLGPVGEAFARWGRWPALALLVVAGLAVLYRYAPDRDKPQFKWASPGAIIATVLWLIGSGLFSLYMTNFGQSSYARTYGVLAGVIILLLWLFLTGYIVLMGAEINAELERQTRRDTTEGDEKPMGERRAQAADTVAETPS